MKTQWHPLFASLLKAQLDPYFEVEPKFPVSELPRQADVLLLRKRDSGPTPFNGIWGHLNQINALEYKSPDDTATEWDLVRLIEVGSGALYRLHEQGEVREPPLSTRQLSLWLLTPRITNELKSDMDAMQMRQVEDTPGLYRGRIGLYPLWILNYNEAVVEVDTLPLHLLIDKPWYQHDTVQTLRTNPAMLERMAALLMMLQPELWRTLLMDVQKRTGPTIRWDVIAQLVDLREVLPHLKPEERLAGLDAKTIARYLKPEDRLAGLKPEDRLAGLKPEDRLAGLKPEDRLLGLTEAEIAALLQRYQAPPSQPQ